MDQISCFVPVPSENGANALCGLSSNSIVTTPCHRQHQVQSGLREGQNFGVRTSDDLVLSVSPELAFNIDSGLQAPGEWMIRDGPDILFRTGPQGERQTPFAD